MASRNSPAIAEALDRVKTTGEMPPQASQVLEQALADIWRRIRAKPDSYIMTDQECSVMLCFQERHKNDSMFIEAVKRYWIKKHGAGATPPINGRSSSSSK